MFVNPRRGGYPGPPGQPHGVKVGAHPSLPDREGFGRREMKMGREELTASVLYQIGALSAFLRAEGMELNHVKPHGSLYGMAARDEEVEALIRAGAKPVGLGPLRLRVETAAVSLVACVAVMHPGEAPPGC